MAGPKTPPKGKPAPKGGKGPKGKPAPKPGGMKPC